MRYLVRHRFYDLGIEFDSKVDAQEYVRAQAFPEQYEIWEEEPCTTT